MQHRRTIFSRSHGGKYNQGIRRRAEPKNTSVEVFLPKTASEIAENGELVLQEL